MLLHLKHDDCPIDTPTASQDLERGIFQRDTGMNEWEWPQGVGLYGLSKLILQLNDLEKMTYLTQWYHDNIKRGLPSRNIDTTAPYLALVDILDLLDNKEYYST